MIFSRSLDITGEFVSFWEGADTTGKRVTPGIYYYQADVDFATGDPSQRNHTSKGWIEVVH